MKVLITGGAGFIGSHLTDRLLQRGDEVMVLDDLSTGRAENVRPFEENPGFSFRLGSALDEAIVAEMVDEADQIIHLAAAVGVRLIVERPVHTIETNVRATEVVLAAAATSKTPVIIASTSEVYGKSTKIPFSEDDDLNLGATIRSRWAYACSKALDEWLGFAYQHERGVPVTVIRFFNTVGPRQVGQYGMVLPNFARQAIKGEPITVYGDGLQSRCFGHVRDAVEATTRLMDHPDTSGQVFNVGTDREVSIIDLAKLVKERASSSSEIVFIPYEKAYAEGFEDMPRRQPCLEKLVRVIGFRPETTLEAIIDDVLDDQRSRAE